MFFALQAATAAILFTGGNTSFTGFPFLASFVAEDSFLPRWLTRRGHRLVFSNGIILLAALSLTLMLVAGATVDALIAFYAIGVFTGFAMAGFGMARYHLRTREPGWRRRLVINTAGGIYTALVVVLFAVVKFTEGAWLIVIIFPVLVYTLIRLNRQYRKEAAILDDPGGTDLQPHPPNYSRRVVLLLVDGYDLATIAAIRYAKSLQPSALRAVHFSLDSARADKLRQQWLAAGIKIPLELADCPDRRLGHAAAAAGRGRGGRAGHPRDRGPAAPQLLAAGRAAAARPHRGPDRPPGQPRPAARRPPSSPSTSSTRSRRSTPGGPGHWTATPSRSRRPTPTRSGRCTRRAGPPSRAACARAVRQVSGGRAEEADGTPCWRATWPTRPAS